MGDAASLAESMQVTGQGQDAPPSSLVPGFAGGKEFRHALCHPAGGLEGRPCPLLFTSLVSAYEIRA